MDLAASTAPWSISARAVSICREKKGMVPKIRGTITPLVPMAVPEMKRLMGIKRTSRMINGMDLKKLITLSRMD
jgi:hypothetical protein